MNDNVFELLEPGPDSVALARIVTDPASTPVSTSVATPPLVEPGAAKPTEPGPPVCPNDIAAVLSRPVSTVFPYASWIVAVKLRGVPKARSDVPPVSEICEASAWTTLSVAVPVAPPPWTVTVFPAPAVFSVRAFAKVWTP